MAKRSQYQRLPAPRAAGQRLSCPASGGLPGCPGPHSSVQSIPPALLSSLPLPSFFPSFPFFLSFIWRIEWLLSAQPSVKLWISRLWLAGHCVLFHHAEPALWASSVSRLSHQTEGSPGRAASGPQIGPPKSKCSVTHSSRPPPGQVAEGPVPPCSQVVCGQVCLG